MEEKFRKTTTKNTDKFPYSNWFDDSSDISEMIPEELSILIEEFLSQVFDRALSINKSLSKIDQLICKMDCSEEKNVTKNNQVDNDQNSDKNSNQSNDLTSQSQKDSKQISPDKKRANVSFVGIHYHSSNQMKKQKLPAQSRSRFFNNSKNAQQSSSSENERYQHSSYSSSSKKSSNAQSRSSSNDEKSNSTFYDKTNQDFRITNLSSNESRFVEFDLEELASPRPIDFSEKRLRQTLKFTKMNQNLHNSSEKIIPYDYDQEFHHSVSEYLYNCNQNFERKTTKVNKKSTNEYPPWYTVEKKDKKKKKEYYSVAARKRMKLCTSFSVEHHPHSETNSSLQSQENSLKDFNNKVSQKSLHFEEKKRLSTSKGVKSVPLAGISHSPYSSNSVKNQRKKLTIAYSFDNSSNQKVEEKSQKTPLPLEHMKSAPIFGKIEDSSDVLSIGKGGEKLYSNSEIHSQDNDPQIPFQINLPQIKKEKSSDFILSPPQKINFDESFLNKQIKEKEKSSDFVVNSPQKVVLGETSTQNLNKEKEKPSGSVNNQLQERIVSEYSTQNLNKEKEKPSGFVNNQLQERIVSEYSTQNQIKGKEKPLGSVINQPQGSSLLSGQKGINNKGIEILFSDSEGGSPEEGRTRSVNLIKEPKGNKNKNLKKTNGQQSPSKKTKSKKNSKQINESLIGEDNQSSLDLSLQQKPQNTASDITGNSAPLGGSGEPAKFSFTLRDNFLGVSSAGKDQKGGRLQASSKNQSKVTREIVFDETSFLKTIGGSQSSNPGLTNSASTAESNCPPTPQAVCEQPSTQENPTEEKKDDDSLVNETTPDATSKRPHAPVLADMNHIPGSIILGPWLFCHSWFTPRKKKAASLQNRRDPRNRRLH